MTTAKHQVVLSTGTMQCIASLSRDRTLSSQVRLHGVLALIESGAAGFNLMEVTIPAAQRTSIVKGLIEHEWMDGIDRANLAIDFANYGPEGLDSLDM